jgi:hypothetical protein
VTVDLAPESVEAIAQRVTELLRTDPIGEEWVDASQIAPMFSVSRDYIYQHADELGVRRLGSGPKARLRFNPEIVADRLAPRPHPVTDPHRTKPRPRRRQSGVELLPIKGASR